MSDLFQTSCAWFYKKRREKATSDGSLDFCISPLVMFLNHKISFLNFYQNGIEQKNQEKSLKKFCKNQKILEIFRKNQKISEKSVNFRKNQNISEEIRIFFRKIQKKL